MLHACLATISKFKKTDLCTTPYTASKQHRERQNGGKNRREEKIYLTDCIAFQTRW